MPRYFTLISHHNPKRRNAFYEQVQRQNLTLSIGWGEVNPIGSSRSRIRRNIEQNYRPAGLNVTNGLHSLTLFSELGPGDIVFVRGNSAIIDIAIITGHPFYQYGLGQSGLYDYCTKVNFTPLFGTQSFPITISQIPDRYRRTFVFENGRSRTMKELSEPMALVLLRRIVESIQ